MSCHGRPLGLRIPEVSKMQEITINRENKDRLFKIIFGRNENKAWTLSLYNAVNGLSYTNPDDITITTVEDALYLSMKNDISFLIADTMNLYEQQSTYNPNMPARMLTYASMVYSKYISSSNIYMYSEKLRKLPVPKLVTFYNGKKEMPDETMLYLSDSFPEGSDSDIQIKVRMLNINYGRNAELLEKCRPLYDYSFFVEAVREYKSQGYEIQTSVREAIRNLADDSPIKLFLTAHEAEVTMLWITEYDEEKDRKMLRQEGFEEGREEGEARLASLMTKLKDLNRVEDAFKAASDSEFREKLYKEFGL